MRTFSCLILLILAAVLIPVRGQPATIRGSGIGYAGTEIRIYRQSDPISKSMVPIMRVRCDENGKFSFDLSLHGTEKIFLNAGIYNFFIYAVGGKEYELRLPELILKTAEDEQNAFFTPAVLMPEIVNMPSDMNNLMRMFDTEFDRVFNIVADRVMYNMKRNEIPSLIEKLNSLSDPAAPEFFRDFVTFRLIMLNLVARGEYPGRVEDSVLINRKFVPENPAYLDLVEQAFDRYFRDIAYGRNKISFNRAIDSASVNDLSKVIYEDGMATDLQLREYIIMLNLYSSGNDGSIPAERALAIISSIKSEGSSPFIRDLAATLSGIMKSLAAGTVPPDFDLQGINGDRISPGTYAGKYLIISFARSDNEFSVAEYGILKTWYKKYSENLQIVTILRDSDFKTASARMARHGFLWTMLDGSDSDVLEYSYGVIIYPSFLLVDPEGRISIRNCPFPSENLESLIAGKTAIKGR